MNENIDDLGFDRPIDRTGLSTEKWEANIERLDNPHLLCFGTAEMDFRVAPELLKAISQAVERGHFGYPHKRGSYYKAIVSFYKRTYGWNIEADWIDGHVGIYASMYPLIDELTNPGDEIIYQTPVHSVFEELIRHNQRVAVANPLCESNGDYAMDFDGLSAVVTERTKMLLLCSPHNPVGRVWTKQELERLSEFCIARGIVVISDEVYFGLVKKEHSFVPMASISDEASMNTITLTSVAKSFNLSGLKHSLFIARNPIYRAAFRRGNTRNNTYFGGCVIGHIATEVALTDGDNWRASLMDYVDRNFQLLESIFKNQLPQVVLTKPEATYFAWLNIQCLDLSLVRLKSIVETEAQIIVTFGESMGMGGEGHIRINLATARSTLALGLKRLTRALVNTVENST